MSANLEQSAILLIGHGSTLNPDSSAPTHRHASTLRARGLFGQVLVGFWKEEPFLAGALRGAFLPEVFIVPLFISEGYFTEQVIPRELGLSPTGDPTFERTQILGGRRVHYCGPVGTHPSMTQVILARAKDVVERYPGPDCPEPSDCSLFITGHGTGNNENSRKAIEAQVDRIAGLNLYRDVHAIFMEEEPRVESCYDLAQTGNLVVVPFFISDGLHSYEDIPVLLGETQETVQERFRKGEPTWKNPTIRQGKRVWYSRSIGDEPSLANVILERVLEVSFLHKSAK